jgi:hypothetical protein
MLPFEVMSAREIADLAHAPAGPCISIYVPTSRKGLEARQGAIHLKNLIAEVETHLSEKGHRWDEIESLTKAAHDLVGQEDIWQHQKDGLALFLSPTISRAFKLPIPVSPRQSVSEQFDITPLLPMLTGDGRFYLLTVSANEVRLFDSTRFSFAEVPIEGVPQGMAEALWADDHEKQQQWHSGAGASPKGGGRSAMFFGTGDEGSMEQHKVDFKRYFDKVDAALAPLFRQNPVPVILAGVGYLLPIYRKANTSAHLLEGEVHGNQDRATMADLQQASWEIAGPYFEGVTKIAKARFDELIGTGLASADQDEISLAAEAGRIEMLFVSKELQEEAIQPINLAAVQTLLKKGEIFTLEPATMPSDQSMAATFRY